MSSVIRFRKDRLAEEAKHPGQTHYKIFYKSKDGKPVEVSDFWAASEAQAETELEIYRKKQELVDFNDSREYLYCRKGGFIFDLGNGVERESDNLIDDINAEDESVFEKAKTWFKCVRMRFYDLKRAFADFWFLLRHYDAASGEFHNRSEAWNLDRHILDDIEFNVPILINNKCGIPTEFCVKAKAKLHAGEREPGAGASCAFSSNPSDEEIKLAESLWNEELENFLLHVRLYKFYEDSGIVDEKDQAYAEIAKNYGNTIPYKKYTDKEIDYLTLKELADREWSEVWKWWEKYGRNCWD